MPYYRFSENDILYNELKLRPKSEFFIYSGSTFYNQVPQITGAYIDNITHVPTGNISLYEYNIDRLSDQLIHPIITKDGSLTSFKTISTSQLNTDFSYGDSITGSYPLSASIYRRYYAAGETDLTVDLLTTTTTHRKDVEALRNTLEYYAPLGTHYQVSSSYANLMTDEMSIIKIPSIFYGSSMQKGSIDFKFFISGTLAARAQDLYENGALIQTYPSSSYYFGANVGTILYNEGFVFLYDPPLYKSIYDLSFDGNDYLTVTNTVPKIQEIYKELAAPVNVLLSGIGPPGLAPVPPVSPKGDPEDSGDAIESSPWSEPISTPEFPDTLGHDNYVLKYMQDSVPKYLAELDPLMTTITVAAWIKTSAANGPIIVLSGRNDKQPAAPYVNQWGLTVVASKLVGHSGGNSVTSSTTVADGEWHHVAMVSDASSATITLYIDGAAEGTTGVPGPALAGTLQGETFGNALMIGAARGATISYYTGLINEVSIWVDEFTVSDVKELYNNGCPPDIAKHSKYIEKNVAWWNFEQKISANVDYYRTANKTITYEEITSNRWDPEEGQPAHTSILHKARTIGGYAAWTKETAAKPTQTATDISCLSGGFKGLGGGHTETYIAGASDVTASWVHWGATGSAADRLEYSSYSLTFNGTLHTPVLTMFAYAPKSELNHSNNFTSVEYPGIVSSSAITSSQHSYEENSGLKYKNIVSSSYDGYSEPFSKQTYISSIGIYDENKNLIATAKLATPLRKRELDEYIFKLKLDI
tara:strand:+ start:167 stop:2440 length:2274 start_codon:yes stop_codon:yes gene_type:complete